LTWSALSHPFLGALQCARWHSRLSKYLCWMESPLYLFPLPASALIYIHTWHSSLLQDHNNRRFFFELGDIDTHLQLWMCVCICKIWLCVCIFAKYD
jgi:hypothetical protein